VFRESKFTKSGFEEAKEEEDDQLSDHTNYSPFEDCIKVVEDTPFGEISGLHDVDLLFVCG